MSQKVTPPIFVLYDNGGVAAFRDAVQALRKVAPADYEDITGAWDSRGLRLTFVLHDRRRYLAGDPHEAPGWHELRDALMGRLRADGDNDLDRVDDELLLIRAYERFRLKGVMEMVADAFSRGGFSP